MLLFLVLAHSAGAQATLPVYRGFWQLFMIPGDLDDSTHAYLGTEFGLFVSIDGGRTWATWCSAARIRRPAPSSTTGSTDRSPARR